MFANFKHIDSPFLLTVRFEDIVDSPMRACQYLTSFVYNGHQPDDLKVFSQSNGKGVLPSVVSTKMRTSVNGNVTPLSKYKFDSPFNIMKVYLNSIINKCDQQLLIFLLEQQCENLFLSGNTKPLTQSRTAGVRGVHRWQRGGRKLSKESSNYQSNRLIVSTHMRNNSSDENFKSSDQARHLRMHMNADGTRSSEWKFSSYGAKKSCAPRVNFFNKVLQLAKNKKNPLATSLMLLDEDIRRFGYSISSMQSYPYTRYPNEFDEWDLMFNVRGRRHPDLIE